MEKIIKIFKNDKEYRDDNGHFNAINDFFQKNQLKIENIDDFEEIFFHALNLENKFRRCIIEVIFEVIIDKKFLKFDETLTEKILRIVTEKENLVDAWIFIDLVEYFDLKMTKKIFEWAEKNQDSELGKFIAFRLKNCENDQNFQENPSDILSHLGAKDNFSQEQSF